MSLNRSYYRIMLGRKSSFAQQCHDERWFGGGWKIDEDLTNKLPDNWRDFNVEFIPIFLKANPEKSKIAAGLACSMLHTICKHSKRGHRPLPRWERSILGWDSY